MQPLLHTFHTMPHILPQVHSPFESRFARATAHDLPAIEVPLSPPLPQSDLPPVQVAVLLRKVS